MKVHDSALKHGIQPEDAIHVLTPTENGAVWVEDLDDDSPARQLRWGFDTRGRLVETVVLVFDSGNELIIHAMKARPQMFELLP